MTMIAALEDQVIDTLQMIDTENGELDFYGFKVRDSRKGGYGKINAMDILPEDRPEKIHSPIKRYRRTYK